jgi:DNA-binding response OmpR family regulator
MTKRILVVDDEEDVMEVLVGRLREHGYEVVPSRDGKSALHLARTDKFDLIILDILMPGMSGIGVAEVLKEDQKTKNIPIIFLTALGVERKGIGYTLSGSEVVFAKPFDSKKLFWKIDEILGSGV